METTEQPAETETVSLEDSAKLFYSETKAEPTEEAKAEPEPIVEVTPEEEPETEEAKAEPETEGSEETKETEKPEYSNEELFVELDGKEYSLKEIDEWRLGELRQSDYTKKTQEHADNVRSFEADRQQQIDAAVTDKYADIIGTIDALILEADVDEYGEKIDWKELRKTDIEEYDRRKAIKDKRIAAKDTATDQNVKVSNEGIQAKATAETQKLTTANNWVKDGKETEAYKTDMKMINDELDRLGISEQDRGGLLVTGVGQFVIDACRYRQTQEKAKKVETKVRKLPIVTKPKATGTLQSKSATEIFYPNSKQG